MAALKRLDRAQEAIWLSLDAACQAYAKGLRAKPLVDRHFTAGNSQRYGFAPLSRDYFLAKQRGIVSLKGGKHFLPPKLKAAIDALPKGKRKHAIAFALGTKSGSKLDKAVPFQSSTGTMRGIGSGSNLPTLVLTGDLRRAIGAKNATIRINRTSGVCTITFRDLPTYAQYLHEGTPKMPARSPVEPSHGDIAQMRAIAQQFFDDATGKARANPMATKRR